MIIPNPRPRQKKANSRHQSKVTLQADYLPLQKIYHCDLLKVPFD